MSYLMKPHALHAMHIGTLVHLWTWIVHCIKTDEQLNKYHAI
jgi:hypothetical protein